LIRRRRPPLRKAARAGELLDKLLQSYGLDKKLQQYRALVIWDEVVGPQIAARARPSKIRGSVLEVCVDQPAWMQQLQLMKPQILKKLNEQLGEGEISEIFLKRGKVPPRLAEEPPAPPVWKSVRLDQREKQQIEDLLKAVEDPELRTRLERMLSKQARLLKVRN
jgi:hypothetical protein